MRHWMASIALVASFAIVRAQEPSRPYIPYPNLDRDESGWDEHFPTIYG